MKKCFLYQYTLHQHNKIKQMNPEQEIVPNFTFIESDQFDKTKITKIDLLPNHQCFVLHNVLTLDECNQLVTQGESYGFIDLANTYTQNYRTNKRIINFNQELKQILWKRINEFCDTTIEVDGKHPTISTTYFTSGTWKIDNLNDNFRLCKYNPTNFFKRHIDEGYHPDPKNHRSLKTCMLYLNSDFEGGETVFYFDKDNEHVLKPEAGMCLIFNQNILHEGLVVKSGLKYFIRTDILYKKIDSKTNDTLTKKQLCALELYDQAVEFERDCKHEEAICMYKAATKMYDLIEDLYNFLY